MRQVRVIVGAVVVFLLAGAVARAAPPACPAGIAEAAAGWIAASRARDVDAAIALYDDEAIILPPGKAPVAGREAIRAYFRADFAGEWRLTEFRSELASCVVAGELAVVTADNAGRVEKGAKESATFSSKSSVVYRLGRDGRWRFFRDIWNASPARAGATASP